MKLRREQNEGHHKYDNNSEKKKYLAQYNVKNWATPSVKNYSPEILEWNF